MLVDSVKFHPKNQATITNGHHADLERSIGIIEFDGQFWPLGEMVIKGKWATWYISDTDHYWAGLRSKMPMAERFDTDGKVEAYKAAGFGDKPDDYAADMKAIEIAEDAVNAKRRAEDGYVFPSSCIVGSVAEMQGGFSDEVFNHAAVANYITQKDGKVFAHGYIGNSNRRIHLDKFLEFHLSSNLGWTVGEVARWLTSTYGRHFCDSYEREMDCFKQAWTKC